MAVEVHASNDEVEEAWEAICAQAGVYVAQLERAGAPRDKVSSSMQGIPYTTGQ